MSTTLVYLELVNEHFLPRPFLFINHWRYLYVVLLHNYTRKQMLFRHCSNHVTNARLSLLTRQGGTRSRSWSPCPDHMASDIDRQNWTHRTQPLKQVAETSFTPRTNGKEEKENVSLQEHCGFSQFKFSSSPLAFPRFCVPSINVTLTKSL